MKVLFLCLGILIFMSCKNDEIQVFYELSPTGEESKAVVEQPYRYPPEMSIQTGFLQEGDTLWFYYLSEHGKLVFQAINCTGHKELDLTSYENHSSAYLDFPLSFSYQKNELYLFNQTLDRLIVYHTDKQTVSVHELPLAHEGIEAYPCLHPEAPAIWLNNLLLMPYFDLSPTGRSADHYTPQLVGLFYEAGDFSTAKKALTGYPSEYRENKYYANVFTTHPLDNGALINYQLSDSVDFVFADGRRERVYAGVDHPPFYSMPDGKPNMNSAYQYLFKQTFYRRGFYLPEKDLIVRTLVKGSEKYDEETGKPLADNDYFSLVIGKKGASQFSEIPISFDDYGALGLYPYKNGIWLCRGKNLEGEGRHEFTFVFHEIITK